MLGMLDPTAREKYEGIVPASCLDADPENANWRQKARKVIRRRRRAAGRADGVMEGSKGMQAVCAARLLDSVLLDEWRCMAGRGRLSWILLPCRLLQGQIRRSKNVPFSPPPHYQPTQSTSSATTSTRAGHPTMAAAATDSLVKKVLPKFEPPERSVCMPCRPCRRPCATRSRRHGGGKGMEGRRMEQDAVRWRGC